MYARSRDACVQAIYTTDYLGFVIGPDGLRMDTPKIQVILDCPAPEKVRMSNRSWVNFSNFYRRLIASYSDVTVPLTRLTRKDARGSGLRNVNLSTPQNGLSAHILHDFDPPLPPAVETDASDYAIAGILSVHTEDGQVHPSRPSVAPYLVPSSTTTPTTRSYSPSKLSRPGNTISSLVTIGST